MAAIVLTGGLSRRMGTDKATLVVDGVAMVDRVLAVVSSAGIEHVVVAGSLETPDHATSNDSGEPQGPLAGIVSGWRYLQEQYTEAVFDPVVVLSCDLPSLSVAVVTELVAQSLSQEQGAVAHDGIRPQPLIAAYRPPAIMAMCQAYEQGERSVRRCFDPRQLVTVDFDPEVLADADTPADLDGFQVQWPLR